MSAVTIDFACNDPDNGDFAGRAGVASITWLGVLCELEHPSWPDGIKFTELPGAIRIHRKLFKTIGSKDWVGNWCWNSYRLSRREYRRLIRTLAANGWRCTSGLTRWTDAFDALREARA
jgi:hypothetical protein